PKRIEYLGLREWPNIEMVATTVPDQVALIHWLWSLMEDRYRRIEEEGARETDFTRVLVLIDEYRQFYGNAKNWWSTIKVSGM
ncbi:cell division protein FtsK, partial [Salmonella enterica subsp. enterica serovar Typhimurium]